MKIYASSGLRLQQSGDITRAEARPQHLKQPEYEEAYDYHTLIYDCFLSGGELVIVGPSLFNLKDIIFPVDVFEFAPPHDYQYLNFSGIYSIHIPCPSSLELPEDGCLQVRPHYQPMVDNGRITINNNEGLLDGKRVLFTLQKNNRIEWIISWATFYANVHKTDAILIYDNGSDAYPLETLYQELTKIQGLKTVVIVKWEYPYGPGAFRKDEQILSKWDSRFCQLGALESARKRFLSKAKSVIVADIDELIVPTQAEWPSIHEFTEQSDCGSVLVNGEFVTQATAVKYTDGSRLPTHQDFLYLLAKSKITPAKYCVVPEKSAAHTQWNYHHITGANSIKAQDKFLLRHFLAISTDWKYPRSNLRTIDPNIHIKDPHLEKLFASLYGTHG